MKAKFFQLLFLITLFCVISPVAKASEIYYVNKNNVMMSEVEYNNIARIHGDYFVDEITLEIFEENKEYYSNPNVVIETSESEDVYLPRSTIFESSFKSIKITKTSTSTSANLIVVTADWKQMPKIKSYDVIGVRLVNTSFANNITTMAFFDGKSYSPAGTNQFNSGYGASIKLIECNNSIKIQQVFKAYAGGTVYASYQHSVKNISLADSKNFTISANGLGSVFKFNNNNLFDQMSGVRIGS